MFDKPICHIKSPYLLPEITQKYLMYGKTLQEVPFTFYVKKMYFMFPPTFDAFNWHI